MTMPIDRMKLVFLHGPAAVGKLSVARELARLTGYKLFHNHLTVDLVGSLFAFGSEPFVALREKIWLSAFHEAATNNVSLVFTFNPENTVRGQFIQDALAVVENAGGKVIFVELTCAEDELERRIVHPFRQAALGRTVPKSKSRRCLSLSQPSGRIVIRYHSSLAR